MLNAKIECMSRTVHRKNAALTLPGVRVLRSAAVWLRCPGLLVLSLGNNSLGDGSGGLPGGALSLLGRLRTLSLDGNRLRAVSLGLPLSTCRIRCFRGTVFAGASQLAVLDLSGNRLTDSGLLEDSLQNATRPRLSGLVRVQLEHNLVDPGGVDALAFRCLRGSHVLRFY
ncbi:hypothetical protein CRUP_028243 [Coryphaenoides rupestris]|nr:hypothetical protein CRUP_028243 [Coryphaenoides rupestris]